MSNKNPNGGKQPLDEKNLDGYGAPPIAWSRVRERLEQGFTQSPGSGGPARHTCWLATVRPDGRPHVMPLGILWVDGAFYFTAGLGTRKAKNLARDPHCVITVATYDFDLVFEGEATKVIGDAELRRSGRSRGPAIHGWSNSPGLLRTKCWSSTAWGPRRWINFARPSPRRACRLPIHLNPVSGFGRVR